MLLKSGEALEADIIVTATGFNLCVLGDIEFKVDGDVIDFADKVTWRGMMFDEVPNMMWVFGYLRASWTLRADLLGDHLCRLLGHMDKRGATVVTPKLRPQDEGMELRPWVEADNFNAGYLQRNMHPMPRQGAHDPWVMTQDYERDAKELPSVDLDDGTLVYSTVDLKADVA